MRYFKPSQSWPQNKTLCLSSHFTKFYKGVFESVSIQGRSCSFFYLVRATVKPHFKQPRSDPVCLLESPGPIIKLCFFFFFSQYIYIFKCPKVSKFEKWEIRSLLSLFFFFAIFGRLPQDVTIWWPSNFFLSAVLPKFRFPTLSLYAGNQLYWTTRAS